MKEHPILFTAAMVTEILAGRKTETRRLIKPQPVGYNHVRGKFSEWDWCSPRFQTTISVDTKHGMQTMAGAGPHGVAGDVLWVKETWGVHRMYDDVKPSKLVGWQPEGWEPSDGTLSMWYRQFNEEHPYSGGCHPSQRSKWRPSIFMPRWVSRIDLEVLSVRAERLQDIGTAGIIAEGVHVPDVDYSVAERPDVLEYERAGYARGKFRELWDGINAARGFPWKSNPWVRVIEFKVVDKEIAA